MRVLNGKVKNQTLDCSCTGRHPIFLFLGQPRVQLSPPGSRLRHFGCPKPNYATTISNSKQTRSAKILNCMSTTRTCTILRSTPFTGLTRSSIYRVSELISMATRGKSWLLNTIPCVLIRKRRRTIALTSIWILSMPSTSRNVARGAITACDI